MRLIYLGSRAFLAPLLCVAMFAQDSVADLVKQADPILGQVNEAERVRGLLNRAVTMCDAGPQHTPDCARAYDLFALFLFSKEPAAVVEPLCKKALDIDEQNPPEHPANMALALELEAAALRALGQDGSAPLADRAATIRRGIVREASPPYTPPAAGVRKIGRDVTAPRVTYKVEPSYTEYARMAKQQGTVFLKLVVDDKGVPQEIELLRSLGFGLDERAVETVRTWRFQPATTADG